MSQQARLSLTTFGDLHQLCLADRPAATASRPSAGIRRSRGIHYTPPAIVDYLTRRVFGAMNITGKPRDDFRVLDPSCGCGAFLIAAARQLFRAGNQQEGRDFSLQSRLDLLCCISGIDIDAQAVLWSRRVLLLAAWLDTVESNCPPAGTDSIHVPDLSKTVIAADFLSARIAPVDAIIGGPPFVRIHQLRRSGPAKLEEYKSAFRSARSGQFDLYMLFFEKAIDALRSHGRLAWSVSNTFLRSNSGRVIRQLISSQCMVQELVEFEARKLYPDAITQIALVLLEKTVSPSQGRHVWIRGNHGLQPKLQLLIKSDRPVDSSIAITDLTPSAYSGRNWLLGAHETTSINARLKPHGTTLGKLPLHICSGIVTGADEVFLVRKIRIRADGITVICNRAGSEHLIESAMLRPLVRNRDVHGFDRPIPRTLCIVPYDEAGNVLDEPQLQKQFPRGHRYLKLHHRQLAARQSVPEPHWYSFRAAAVLKLPPGPRILLKRISSCPDYAIDLTGSLLCHGTIIVLSPTSPPIDPLILLGILNSSIFWNFVRSVMPTMAEGHAIQTGRLRGFSLPLQSASDVKSDLESARAVVRQLLLPSTGDFLRSTLRQELNRLVSCLYEEVPASIATPIYSISGTVGIES